MLRMENRRSGSMACLRCGGEMAHAFTENIQLGKTSVLLGDWPNIWAGAMRVEVWCCKDCGRLEFFSAENSHTEGLPQTTCPHCSRSHDFDYPKCPFCGHVY